MVLTSTVAYEDLLNRARDRLHRSNDSTSAGRRKLVDLVEELRTTAEAAGDSPLLGTAAWRILEIEVQGFGGIGNAAEPLRLELSPTPGVTVIRGDNGSGKSSLAGAVSWLLAGDPQAPATETARGDLWHATAITTDADLARIRVVLARDEDRLHLLGELREDAGTITAELRAPEVISAPRLDSHWASAVTASNSCFAYARLRDRLRKEADLQTYLEGLLVLGPAWIDVHETLSERARRAFEAAKALDQARTSARNRLAEVDRRFTTDPRRPIPPPAVSWPDDWADDPDAWADAHGLLGRTTTRSTPPAVAADLEQAGSSLADAVVAAEERLVDAERQVANSVTPDVLHHLRALVTHTRLPDEVCPVCGTEADWRGRTRALVDELAGLTTECTAVEHALVALHLWAQRDLAPLATASEAEPGALLARFTAAVVGTGCTARGEAHQAAGSLVGWLRSADFGEWATRRRAESDASIAWHDARRDALAELHAVWTDRPEAAHAADWKTAEATLTEIQKALREERQDELNTRLREAVGTLLPGSGVHLARIRHKRGAKRKWGLDIALQIGGRTATLGMLSSGQRNALLLASLLCTNGQGPFGFLVVDDPVHALDDLRVDLLARELTRIAAERQVVVLTHDGRLEEHLRAWNPGLQTVVLHRDADRATVSVTSRSSPWDHLLETARTFVDGTERDRWTSDIGMHDVVSGMCRHAVDGAVRQAVIKHRGRARAEHRPGACAAGQEGKDARPPLARRHARRRAVGAAADGAVRRRTPAALERRHARIS